MPFLEGPGESSRLRNIIAAVSRDKNLDRAVIVEALEQAMVHAARRDHGMTADLEATYNEELDEIELFQFQTVVGDDKADDLIPGEITLSEAKKFDPQTEIGDSLGIKIESDFGRIAAQAAKQIIIQKVRDAERSQVYEEFKGRVGEVLSGNVRRFERQDIVLDLGRAEAVLPQKEQMHGERFRLKDRVQGYVLEVKRSARGPQVVLSRAHPGFLIRLFEQHVTEIYDGIVSIESAARDPGLRSKMAVYSKDSTVDPVGACVGMKGARVQAVVQELNGEKIDIIPWDRDPAKLVCNALAPAVVSKVIVDEDRHAMEVIVSEDQLSLAIGKRGQNVRLAAQLTGWRLDIKSEAKLEEQLQGVRAVLASIQGLGDMHAGILVHEGIKTPSDLADISPRVLCRLLNLEASDAEVLLERARAKAKELERGVLQDTSDYRADDARAAPLPERKDLTKADHEAGGGALEDQDRKSRLTVFMRLRGVGEATAMALVDGGYVTIGDVIADSADEVTQKTGLTIGVARTVQIAADRHLQEEQLAQQKGS